MPRPHIGRGLSAAPSLWIYCPQQLPNAFRRNSLCTRFHRSGECRRAARGLRFMGQDAECVGSPTSFGLARVRERAWRTFWTIVENRHRDSPTGFNRFAAYRVPAAGSMPTWRALARPATRCALLAARGDREHCGKVPPCPGRCTSRASTLHKWTDS